MGMLDRGAELRWLSQYPHEDEILFPPLTGCEVQGIRVEGAVRVVSIRLSVNLTTPTVEQVVAHPGTNPNPYSNHNLEIQAQPSLQPSPQPSA